MKITPKIIEELKNEDTLTKKREKEIQTVIGEKVGEIWEFIAEQCHGKVDWWCYSTDRNAFHSDGDGSDGGYFCPDSYSKWVEIIGENTIDNHSDHFSYGFETSLLFADDWKEQIIHTLSEEKKNKNSKN